MRIKSKFTHRYTNHFRKTKTKIPAAFFQRIGTLDKQSLINFCRPHLVHHHYIVALVGAFAFYVVPILYAYANPESGTVSSGSAAISASGNTLTIDQYSQKVVIDWRSFNIDQNEVTRFNQVSSSAIALNRINDVNPSRIFGTLSANGNLILLNPNGVLFGAGSRIDVNSIIATTANISNQDFMAGNMNFRSDLPFLNGLNSNPNAAIINEGTITARNAGLVGLVAPTVINNGIINARLGKVHLASGDQFTLDLYGDGLISIAVSDDVSKQIVQNTGTINAEGGIIAMTASAGRNVVDSLIDVKGNLNATTVEQKNGKIYIYAEGANKTGKVGESKVSVSGNLDASGTKAGDQSGGSIDIVGDKIEILNGANINASGNQGGGTIRIGGDYQGKNIEELNNDPLNPFLNNAIQTVVQENTKISADGIINGNGGKVIIWADDTTDFAGSISAKGGSLSGNGGFVETSGKNVLSVSGRVDASSKFGSAGKWLLDPTNVTIQATAGAGVVTTGSIQSSLNNGTSVQIDTSAAGAQAGDITVAANSIISKTAGGDATLTLKANRNITINSGTNISSTSGKLNIVLVPKGFAGSGDTAKSGVLMTGTTLNSNGGKIVIGGNINDTTPTIDTNYGRQIAIFSSNISSGAGDIYILGSLGNEATDTSNGAYTGNPNQSPNLGANAVSIAANSLITATSGNINIIGTAYSADVGSRGIRINNSEVRSTGAGNINMTGSVVGKGAIVGITGVALQDSALINLTSTSTGNITIDGTSRYVGASSAYGRGVSIQGSKVISDKTSGSGNITITGRGGAGGTTSTGVLIENSTPNANNGFVSAESLISTKVDNITINGFGGNATGTENYGAKISSDIISTGSANININASASNVGTPTDASNAKDIFLSAGYNITNSSGSINLTAENNIITGSGSAKTLKTAGGAVNLQGNLVLGSALTVDTTNSGVNTAGGNVTFGKTINGNQNVTVTSGTGGKTTFNGVVGGTTALSALDVTSGGGVDFNNNVTANTISANTSSGVGNINIGAGKVITANAATGSGVNLTTSSSGAINTQGGTIRTQGSTIDINGALNLATAALNLQTNFNNTAGGNINFGNTGNTINGNQNLIITSGTGGKTTFNGVVGGTTALSALDITSGGGVDFNNNVTANTITASSSTGTGNITIANNSIIKANSTGAGNVISLNTSASGSIISDGGTLQTNGATINIGGKLRLRSNTLNIDTTNAGANTTGKDVLFSQTIDGFDASNKGSLTVKSGTAGKTTFNEVGGATAIGNLSATSGGGVDFNQNIIANTITANTGSGIGNINLADTKNLTANTITGTGINLTTSTSGSINTNSGTIRTGGDINIYGALNLGAALNIRSDFGSAGGNITFGNSIDGNRSLGIISGTAGKTTFNGAVGGTTALNNLTITSGGGVDFNNNVTANTIVANVASTGAGDITLSNNAIIKAISTDVGNVISLINDSTSGAIISNGGTLQTNGAAIGIGGKIKLRSGILNVDTTNNGANSVGKDVLFSQAIDGFDASNKGSLAVKSGTSGKTTFNGVVGGTTATGDLSITSGGGVDFNQNITANTITANTSSGAGNIAIANNSIIKANSTSAGNVISLNTSASGSIISDGGTLQTNGATINIGGKLRLRSNTLNIDTTNAGANATGKDVLFSQTIDGFDASNKGSLAVKSGTTGKTTFNGVVGGATAIGDLSITSGGGVDFNQNIKAVTIFANSTSGTGDITIGSGASLQATSTTGIAGTTNTNNPFGSSIILASGRNFKNNSGSTTPLINAGSTRSLVYSYSPEAGNDILGGIVRATKRYSKTYSGYSPSSVAETGNVFLYSFTPTLEVKANDASTTYGTAATLTTKPITGMIDGDLASDLYNNTPTLNSTAINAGTYNGIIDPGLVTATAIALGYQVNYTNGNLTIGKADLIATANDVNRIYGFTDTPTLTASYSGFKYSDNAGNSGIAGVGLSTTAAPGSNAGTYDIDVNTAGSLSTNYNIITDANSTGTFTIGKADLIATANDVTRTYGFTDTPTLTASYSGFKYSDNASNSGIAGVGLSTTAAPGSNAGTYDIDVNTAGSLSTNYNIITDANSTGTFTIGKADLIATANDVNRTYGFTDTPTLTASYSGFKYSDNASNSGIAGVGLSTTAAPGSNAGTYDIDVNTAGSLSTNYNIITDANSTGTFTIGKADLIATANDVNRIYGFTDTPTLTASYSGFKYSDNASNSGITGVGLSTTAAPGSNAGTYDIDVNTAGSLSTNYNIITDANSTGTFTIGKADLIATANDVNRIYGFTDTPTLTASYSGFKYSDNAGNSGIAGVGLSTIAAPGSNAGTYDIDVNTAGSLSTNYNIITDANSTGTFTIGKADLIATANDVNRIYGFTDTPTLTASYSGFKYSDNAGNSGIAGVGLSTTAAPGSNAGTYDIGVNTAGSLSTNYNIITDANSTGTFTIGKADLIATANDVNRIYGFTDTPTLTASYSGFKYSDNAGNSGITGVGLSTTAAPGSNAGTYDIDVNTAGSLSTNYNIITDANSTGTFAIGKADLTIKADNKSKIYGDLNPVLTASYFGLVNNDTASTALTSPVNLNTEATNSSEIGTYSIDVSNGMSDNYNLIRVSGILTVDPKINDLPEIPELINNPIENQIFKIAPIEFYKPISVKTKCMIKFKNFTLDNPLSPSLTGICN